MTQQTVTVTVPPAAPATVNSESTGTHATSLFRRSTFISSVSSSASQSGSLVTGSTSSIPAHGSAVSGSSSALPRNMSHFSASSSTHTGTLAAAVQRSPLLPQPPLSTSGWYTHSSGTYSSRGRGHGRGCGRSNRRPTPYQTSTMVRYRSSISLTILYGKIMNTSITSRVFHTVNFHIN